jgi:putative selenium metabolism protein SsnA
MASPLLIVNGVLADPSTHPKVVRDHALLIEGGRIASIAPRSSFTQENVATLDAGGMLVLPGFINAHTHCYSTFACGLHRVEPSTDFLGVLDHLWWKLDRALSPDDCYYSAMNALLAAIRSGTTTVIDHHSSPSAIAGSLDVLARAVRQAGVRACLCYEVSDRDGVERAQEGIDENRRFLDLCRNSSDSRVRAMFGLHASFTLSGKTLEAAAAVSKDARSGVHIHVAESTADQLITTEKYGKRIVERLQLFGLLGSDTIAAHCVHLSDAERASLASTGTMVVHNPQSNMNNAVGIAGVGDFVDDGITIGLGTDAMTADMLEELRAGIWAQRHNKRDPSAGFDELTLALWSGNPAIASRVWGTPVGIMSEGALADLVIVDYDPPTPLTDESLMGHLVFGMLRGRVATTIVGGTILMKDRQLAIDVDEHEVMMKSRECAQRVWKRF